MKVDELFASAKDSVEAKMVYAEPVERDGTVVIPAARIAAGGGAGNGQDKQGQQGEGGGLGIVARPAGAYVIKDGNLHWQPAVDVNRLVAIIGAVLIVALVRITRRRARPSVHRDVPAVEDGQGEHRDNQAR